MNKKQKLPDMDKKQALPPTKAGLESLPVSQKYRTLEEIGFQYTKNINSAVKKSNKDLAKYGYKISVTINFHEIDKDE